MTSTTEAPPGAGEAGAATPGSGGPPHEDGAAGTDRPFLPLPPPLDSRARRIHRIVIGLLLVFGFVQGAYWTVTTMAWSPVDEVQHFAYVEQLARGGGIPTVGVDLVSDDALAGVKDSTTNPYKSSPYQATNEDPNWGGTRQSYEGVHGPTYYVAMVPFYWIGAPLGINGSLYGVRIGTVLVAIACIPLTWLLARRLFPDKPVIWLLAPALMAAVSSMSAGTVSNDPMAVALATVAILVFLRALSRPGPWTAPALAGAVFGLTLVTKMTSLVLVPLLGLAFLAWLVVSRPRFVAVLRWAGLFVAGTVVTFGPWLAWNLRTYHATSAAGVVSEVTGNVLPPATALTLSIIDVHAWVARLGIFLAPMPIGVEYQALWERVFVVTFVAGLVATAVRRRWRDLAVLAWCGFALPLAFLSMEVIVFGLFGGAGGPVGRHLLAALPPAMIMLSAAAVFVVGSRWAPVAMAWFIAAGLILHVAVSDRFITGTYLVASIDRRMGPVVYQDYADSAWDDRTAITVDVSCVVGAVGVGFAGVAPTNMTITSASGTSEVWGATRSVHIPTYRLTNPLQGPITIELPPGSIVHATPQDRSPEAAFSTGVGDPVVTTYCEDEDPDELSFRALYPVGHPEGVTLGMLQSTPWVIAGAGVVTAVGLTVGAAVAEVRRRRRPEAS